MKSAYLLLISFLFAYHTHSQEQYLTKNGAITFFSSTPIEDIKAENNQVLSIIDVTKRKMAISILIKSFLFEKALMQEHFNENYLESDKFPKATFKGDILNFDRVETVETKCDVKGIITIHGVSKQIVVPSIFKRNGETILVKGTFNILLEDFDVKIPRLVFKKIAEEINITFEFNHKPYN